jgi:DnaJ-class molecular chaperone
MNYYDILGVDKNSSQDDIKKAYRKKAIEHHPDKGGDEARFREAAEAYETLSDDQKRREYDMFGQRPNGGNSGGFRGHGFDMDDIFSRFGDMFGGNPFGNFSQKPIIPLEKSNGIINNVNAFANRLSKRVPKKHEFELPFGPLAFACVKYLYRPTYRKKMGLKRSFRFYPSC